MSTIRILFLGVVVFFSINSHSQKLDINSYKYVIIPESFSFLTKNDAYQLNSLTRFLFKKYGFNAFNIAEGLPDDLKADGCKGLRADVKKKPGLFWTRLIIELKNCNGVTVFTSSEGKSREKDFKRSYHEALREAFKDVKALNYKYIGDSDGDSTQISSVAISENKGTKPVDKRPIHKPTKEKKKVIVEDKEDKVKSVVGNKNLTYVFNEKLYVFKKQVYGYELLESEVSIGKIIKTNRDNTYIIKAGELSGNGYFDGYANFILERVNPVTNKIITDTFARQ